MNTLLKFSLLLLAFSSCFAQSKKPNILFIMSDDHTSQAIGAYGGRLQKLNPTPTIDQIAKEGVIMTNAFCQNAICTPSRASIMTGQSSAVNGCPTLDDHLPKDKQYLPLEIKKAGYQTAIIGKWHLHEIPETFDYYKVLPGQGDYFDPVFYDSDGTERIKWKKYDIQKASQMTGHSSDCIGDSALDWFKNKRDPNKPFYLSLHFKAPHDMFKYAPRYENYLKDVSIPEPENMRDRKNNGSIATRGHNGELIPYIGTSIGKRNPRRNYTNSGAWVKDLDLSKSDEEIHGDAYQGYMKAYLRCVKGVDDNLKRVVDYLKANDLYDNTVIVYTGDQGFFLGEHDYMDKRWAYEESMRMPFIVRYPKTIKKGKIDAIVENIDYAPTILDFAGIDTPKYMHGKSFKAILETGKETKKSKKAAYYHYWMHMTSHDNPGHIAIRTKKHKLIFFYGTAIKSSVPQTPPGWELYDLEKDPREDNNVYNNPKYKKVIAKLKKQLKQLRKEYGEDDSKFTFNKVIDDFWDYDENDQNRAIEISHQYLDKVQKNIYINNRKKQTKKH
ncbi:sulfatase family protein [Wenyingzhuangia aestuarii]|uniref:sulfatase family protein n=1 Tax=Wenyingzhuangia aestuarii TaxID=1647582 RepID=UPI00143931B8|nr:sulfatase [Wenyingzhuangia aestuarii]NJB83671.1 arylsulfatase A-like enzyme [Wenyingzhuangia aestuarii]